MPPLPPPLNGSNPTCMQPRRFTQAAETFATQAAGLFASKATQEKVDLASEQLQEDASLTLGACFEGLRV